MIQQYVEAIPAFDQQGTWEKSEGGELQAVFETSIAYREGGGDDKVTLSKTYLEDFIKHKSGLKGTLGGIGILIENACQAAQDTLDVYPEIP